MAVPQIIAELVTFILPFALLAILALALNLHWGHTGLFNAGIAAFYAIGAYTAAILLTADSPGSAFYPGHLGGYSQHFVVAVAGAFAMAALAGLLIGIPTLKLREDYLAIATLALAEIFRLFLMNARSITAGTIGIVAIPRPFDAFGIRGAESDALLALVFLATILVLLVILEWLTKAPWGRVLRAIREDEEAATVLGKDTYWLKLQAFVIGCGIMGLAGAFLAVLNKVIVPTLFVPFTTFSVYVVVLLGGAGNDRGVLVGAGVFYLLDWASIRLKDGLPPVIADKVAFYRLIVIGLLLILLVMYRPQGILPERKYIPKEA